MPNVELTTEIIEGLKEVFPKLYKVKQADQEFVIRPIMRGEWMFLQEMMKNNSKITANDLDDQIVQRGLVWPQWNPALEFSNLPAGVIPNLSLHIQARSGFRTGLPVSVDEDYQDIQTNGITWDAPSEKEIEEIKKANPTLPIRKISVEGQCYLVRALRRSEWNDINKRGSDAGDLELYLIEKALLYPKNQKLNDVTLPGVISSLSESVLKISGFSDEPVSSEEL